MLGENYDLVSRDRKEAIGMHVSMELPRHASGTSYASVPTCALYSLSTERRGNCVDYLTVLLPSFSLSQRDGSWSCLMPPR